MAEERNGLEEFEKLKKWIGKPSNGALQLLRIHPTERPRYYEAAHELLVEQMFGEQYKEAMITAERALFLSDGSLDSGQMVVDLLVCASNSGLLWYTERENRDGTTKTRRKIKGVPGELDQLLLRTMAAHNPSYAFAVPLLLFAVVFCLAAAVGLLFAPQLAATLAGADGLNVAYVGIAVAMVVSMTMLREHPFQIYLAAGITAAVAVLLVGPAYLLPLELVVRFSPSVGFLAAAAVAFFGWRKVAAYQEKIKRSVQYGRAILPYAETLLRNAEAGKAYACVAISEPEYVDLYCNHLEYETRSLKERLAKHKA